jgi:methyl-accepting chemotaxis protein
MANNNPNDSNSMGDVFKAYQDALNFKDTVNSIYNGINNINSSLGENRIRAVEFGNAISDSASSLTRVGAELSEIDDTITAISEGTTVSS